MRAARQHVLWFDDEWGTPREAGLGPWMRALHAELSVQGHVLKMCNRLQDFSQFLQTQQAGSDKDVSEGRRFDLLILDVMLANEKEKDFGSLDFHDERVFPLDAGAQIAGLIRSTRFDTTRPSWLKTYLEIPVLLLSSSPTLKSTVEKEVGYKRMQRVHTVSKNPVVRSDRSGVEADVEFRTTLRQLLET